MVVTLPDATFGVVAAEAPSNCSCGGATLGDGEGLAVFVEVVHPAMQVSKTANTNTNASALFDDILKHRFMFWQLGR